MRIPDPATISDAELSKALAFAADEIMKTDGDRDHMNSSNLTCGQTQTIAKAMVVAASKLANR
jgi:hypothetical protein